MSLRQITQLNQRKFLKYENPTGSSDFSIKRKSSMSTTNPSQTKVEKLIVFGKVAESIKSLLQSEGKDNKGH